MATSPETTESAFTDIYNELLRFNSENGLSRSPQYLFNAVQDSFLVHYDANSEMGQMFNDTLFNCVTGSALLSFFLDINQIHYSIEEMPSHVYVNVQHKGKTYLAESTDPKFGFLKDNRINRQPYLPDSIDNNYVFNLISSYSNLDKTGVVVKSEISLYELAGLNYYNGAVKALNNNQFGLATQNLAKAYYLYPSKRIEEMYKYCLLQLIYDQNIDFDKRQLYHQQLTLLFYPLSAN